MNIGMIGLGYVGLVTAVGFGEMKHRVNCYDIDKNKIDMLMRREAPIYEDSLQDKLNDREIYESIRLLDNMDDLVKSSQVIFIAVGTPSQQSGEANTDYVKSAVSEIVNALINLGEAGNRVVVIKSTVPVGLTKEMQNLANEMLRSHPKIKVELGFCPEFLREGTAVGDFLNPERIVIGAETDDAYNKIREVFEPFFERGVPEIKTNPVTAEIIKYAANIMLASKISLLNEIADYADLVGGKIEDVSRAVGLDSRIGAKFLSASLGFGGSCFPKDVKAFSYFTSKDGLDLPIAQSIMRSNEMHIERQVDKIRVIARDNGCKKIGFLGTAFKANTDDVRESPAIKLVASLVNSGFKACVTDPQALQNTKKILGDSVEYANTIDEASTGADMLVICTEWSEYKSIDLDMLRGQMNKKIIIDLRNILKRDAVETAGFLYFGIAN